MPHPHEQVVRQVGIDLLVEAGGYARVGQAAFIEVDAARQRPQLAEDIGQAVLPYGQQVRQGRIGDGVAGGTGHEGCDVGHTVVNHLFFDVGLIAQGGWAAGFAGTALVDGEVDDD